MPIDSGLLTSKEAMAYLRVSPSKFWRMKKAGILPAIRFGEKSHRYRLSDLDALIAESEYRPENYTREATR